MAVYEQLQVKAIYLYLEWIFQFWEGGSNVSVFLRIFLQQCGTAVAKQLNFEGIITYYSKFRLYEVLLIEQPT
jgi:hypothetical protein